MPKISYLTTQLGRDGRVVIPAKVRHRLGLRAGKKLHLTIQNNQIVLEDSLTSWRKLQHRLKLFHYKAGNRLLSEELIRDRRKEAEKEQGG